MTSPDLLDQWGYSMSVDTLQAKPGDPDLPDHLPDHLELPEENGEFVQNFRELPQSLLLSSAIWPILESIHPDRQFAVGQDSGIYWRLSDPPEKGAIAPDWFYVPGVPPDLDGHYRRSYVLWKEHIAPTIVIEYASGDGSAERDRTPLEGKFWIYEQAVHAGYYAIIVVETGELEVYRLEANQVSAARTQRTRALPDRASRSRARHLARVLLERDSTLASVV